MLPDLLVALASGAVTGLVAWGGIRVELRYMRRDIGAAHKRMDRAGLPGVWVDS